MGRFLTAVVLGSFAVAQFSLASSRQSQNTNTIEQNPGTQPLTTPATAPSSGSAPVSRPVPGSGTPTIADPASLAPDSAAGARSRALPKLPPAPAGKSTVMGGAIRDVDPVRDQFMLHVYGGNPIKVLFDERTKVYSNGNKISLLHLGPEDHASVETVLDGDHIFARSIHILSHSPQGESQGQVLGFNPRTGKLTLQAVTAREPLILRVPQGTPVTFEGQAASKTASPASTARLTDLVQGTMVSVQFESDDRGSGVVRHVAILAKPGSSFIFKGNVSFLDLHAQRLDLVDPRDNQSYEIFFDPSQFPASEKFHTGMQLTVTATFDGSRYTATAIREK